jgi:hypothetical protein
MGGLVDVITLLLGLSGFGLQNNPKPPTPEASLQYAIADADVVVHFDAASVIPGNYKKLTELADQPQIKASPDLAKAVRKAVTEVDAGRGLVKGLTGIDLATDIADATLFVQVKVGGGDPNAVVAVHGKFSGATIDKIAGTIHKPVIKVKTGAAWLEVDDKNAVAVTADGVLLFGTRGLLADRTKPDWKAPAHGAGTSLGYAADVLATKPVFAISVALSQTARDQALAATGGGQNVATDMLKRGKASSFALYRDGIGWTWLDSTKAGLDAMTDMSNGLVDILRAAQVAPRGLSKILLGALESYRGDPHVDELLRRKADLVKIVDAYIGDGTFKAKVDADAKTLRLSVRLTGKSASDVVPFGVILPAFVVGVLVSEESRSPPPMKISAPPMPPSPPPSSTGKRK